MDQGPRVALLASAFTLLFASTAFGAPTESIAPAIISDQSRDPSTTDDYMRVGFLSDPNLVPTTVARASALRTFFAPSIFFQPPVSLEEFATYVGVPVVDDQNLVAFRCRPPDPNVAVLATWPNVMNLLQDDLGSQFSCPATTGEAANVAFCIAAAYVDSPEPSVTRTLQHTYDVAGQLFDPSAPALASFLQTIYGIFPGFSGLGYAIKGSESGPPFTARNSLRNAIVPEYLLPNLTFAQLGCACIIVPPYPGRSQDPIDPDFIAERGSPTCTRVDRLLPVCDPAETRHSRSAGDGPGTMGCVRSASDGPGKHDKPVESARHGAKARDR